MALTYIVLLIFMALLFIFVLFSIHLVGPNQKGIVTRRGKYKRTAEPKSMCFIIPFLDKMNKVYINEYNEYMKVFEGKNI